MENAGSTDQSRVKSLERVIANIMLVYNASHSISADPAKIIREALSKVLVYYFPLSGWIPKNENEKLGERTEEGALFVEAMADYELSVLGDLDEVKPSFQQLLFGFERDADIQDLHLLVVQVTRFICGGFVVGVSFPHYLCDGRGVCQFLKALAEMARGEIKPTLEPLWNKELLKPETPIYHQPNQFKLLLETSMIEESIHASIFINSKTIKYMKQCILEECKEFCSAFEILTAMAWLARTKALQIPHTETVELFFPTDTKRSLISPLSKGYCHDSFPYTWVKDNVKDLLNGSILRAIMVIKKLKFSSNDEKLKSSIMMNPSALDATMKLENVVGFNDWRRLGFHEVDFGYGDPMNVCPLPHTKNELPVVDYYVFQRPAKNKPDGIKILMCMAPLKMKSFKIEMEAMINKYMTKTCSKL